MMSKNTLMNYDDDSDTERSLTPTLIPPAVGRPALAGGLIGAELGLFAFSASMIDGSTVILAAIIPALIVSGICALVAVGRNEDNKPLARLEREGKELRKLLEKGIISEEEFVQLRQRFIDEYRADPPKKFSVSRYAVWGALWGLLVPLIITAGFVNGYTGVVRDGLMAFLGGGAAGAVAATGGTAYLRRLAYRTGVGHWLSSGELGHHDHLPSGEPTDRPALSKPNQEFQQLGTHIQDQ